MDNTKAKAPLMYGIVGPDGTAYIDENCVASSPDQLFAELNGLNDSPDAGYKIVALGQVYIDAAAPQVVADERALPPPFFYYESNEDGSVEWNEGCVCKDDVYTNAEYAKENGTHGGKVYSEAQMRAALQAAPVQAQEPVAGKPCPYCGSTDCTHDKAYPHPRAPVQPVAVPEGWKLMPVRMNPEMKSILKEAAPKWNAESIYGNLLEAAPAAPAAQGVSLPAERLACPECGEDIDLPAIAAKAAS